MIVLVRYHWLVYVNGCPPRCGNLNGNLSPTDISDVVCVFFPQDKQFLAEEATFIIYFIKPSGYVFPLPR